MILLNLRIIIDIACAFAVIWFVLFILLMYLYGEGPVSCKNLFPIQWYLYIDNKIIIKSKSTYVNISVRCWRSFFCGGNRSIEETHNLLQVNGKLYHIERHRMHPQLVGIELKRQIYLCVPGLFLIFYITLYIYLFI